MSEQIELDGSNLCIPEDAFEKFQAVSMYEETEYITLTNAVPAQIAESCIGEDTAMTSNVGAMVELKSVDEVYVNTENCDGEPRSPPKDDPVAKCDVINTTQLSSGDSNASDVTSKHGKKRGRKKKKITESSDIVSENYSECGTILDSNNGPSESIEDIQNFIQNTEPVSVPKRRGRRPKSSNISSDEFSSSTRDLSRESIIDTTIPTLSKEPGFASGNIPPRKRGRPAKSHESSLTNMSSSNEDEIAIVNCTEQHVLSDTSDSSKKILKKRGRPRKISHEEQNNQIEIIDTVDDSKSSDILESLPVAIFTVKPKKRGRPKKKVNTEPIQNESQNLNNLSSHDTSLEFDDDDISLSNLSKMNHKKIDSDEGMDNEDKIQLKDLLGNNDTMKLEDSEKPISPVKKRGRPKKTHIEAASQVCNKIELQEDNHINKGSDEDKHDGDNVSLSQFKKTLDTSDGVAVAQFDTSDTQVTEQPSQPPSPSAQGESSSVKNYDQIQSPGKRNSKMPIMSDFEYNLDSIESENIESQLTDSQKDDGNSLLVEDVSRRPTRKKVRQTLQYHEESDEDPFANVELSDDEPRGRQRKGRRYNSDDEYFPGDVQGPVTPSSSDSESNNDLDSDKKSRKRKYSKKSDSQSPKKRSRKPNAEEITVEAVESFEITVDNVDNDIEDSLHSSVIKTNDEPSKVWGTTKEFESFLAKKIQGTNLKIKKVSTTENSDAITPLQIPSIDPNEPKKTIQMCTQTTKISTSNVDVQTGCLYDIPMKENISLTAEQSAKSCEFLTSIVNTTAELGKLMTQKSEDFIKKKINTGHVTDTFKMDYCVRKSFLLFKLAKHNLTQMEEDLAKQYEQFLSEHDLLKHREEPKQITPTAKADSDSDCEIVEVPVVEDVKKTSKPTKSVPKFNPKTVFLNKELSIKIAKKPSDDKKINIKGKHTVWINDSVMVKKVKPTQSFLAQDSRNKKPPDQKFVTAEMVSDFFEDYYRKKSLATCALFTSPHWLKVNGNYVCNYFVVKQDFTADIDSNETETFTLNGANNTTATTDTNQDVNMVKTLFKMSETPCPERLITLCTEVLQKLLPISNNGINTINPVNDQLLQKGLRKEPKSLFELCINTFNSMINDTKDNQCSYKNRLILHTKKHACIKNTVSSLKTLCHKKVSELFINSIESYEFIHKSQCDDYSATNKDENNMCCLVEQKADEIKTLFSLCVESIRCGVNTPNAHIMNSKIKQQEREVKSLFSLCVESIRCGNDTPNAYIMNSKIKQQEREVKSLFSLCVDSICCGNDTPNAYIMNSKINQQEREVKSLLSLCVDSIRCGNDTPNAYIMNSKINQQEREVKSLFSPCVEFVHYASDGSNTFNEPVCFKSKDFKELIMHPKIKQHKEEVKSLFSLSFESIPFAGDSSSKYVMHPGMKRNGRGNKTLFSLCVEAIQRIQMAQKNSHKIFYNQIALTQLTPKSLKQICFIKILQLFNWEDLTRRIRQDEAPSTLFINNELAEAFTINSINTLSEEAFHNLQNSVEVPYYEDYDNEESFSNNDDLEPSYEETEEHDIDDNNWASQVQMKELRSCVNINSTADTQIVNGEELSTPLSVAIKSEPIEDISENVQDSIVVKIEPINELDEMTMIPDSVITKSEVAVSSHVPDNDVHLVNRSYSVDTFEEFVLRNKIIQSLNGGDSSEIFSQSSLRVRRQFEPDYDGENDAVDGLLVPHTFTNIYNAKDCLMESSSDEGAEKNTGKKKHAKRKVKPKKPVTKTSNKDVTAPAKEKPMFGANEVDELTRKMKDRIRQEENQSSESELENLPLGKRRNRGIIKDNNKKSIDKSAKDAIQCNDVDSTEQPNISHMSTILNDEATNSSCSNSTKQNNLSNSRDKIKNNRKKKSPNSGDFEGPMELLECEPTIHEDSDDDFHNTEQLSEPNNAAVSEPNNAAVSEPNSYDESKLNNTFDDNVPKKHMTEKENLEIVERCGWSCYPINTTDSKLYQEPFVLLDKLPESFVQTYFQYQEITEQNQVDKEIDRLTNVNSLNRISKDKTKSKMRSKVGVVENNKPNQIDASSILESSIASEQAHEFAPSDDDDANIDDELPPPVPQRHVENTLAKSSLMNDESEDDEGRGPNPQKVRTIKQEPTDEAPIRKRPGPKSKTRVEEPRIPEGELVLTADKMMKEELTLLHAPVTLNSIEINANVETMHKESVTRTRHRLPRKVQQRIKSEEDSSSEEEKQWVTTKEKLLKKLKQAPDASASDAKRAKMVIEFIEKRGEGSETRKVTRGKYRGSRKKFLEREKQLKVLSRELYGESSTDGAYQRKSYPSNFKGRRNIRKVIDKKSLERSTVKAIMEEFERKRRLNDKQNKLREHLGCEENVNVLVINDEVCLEYDFEEDRPAVTVHAFFTKVMKAHQYEGVKFMWDACFESLDKIEAGHPGGGCILAHCMGLGKTLQVLALLHTVLTHPQVGMKRVLVCCPLSTVLNWVDEIHKWIGPVTDQLKVFELSKLKKTYERAYQLEDWYNGGGIFIIGYELFRSLSTLDPSLDDIRPTIIKKIRTALLDPGPDIVVCDEGHLLKNDCSVLAVAMSRVATRRRIVLTGTPMQNNLREYYCMVNFIKPNLLGSYPEYSNRFANPIMNGQHRDSSEEDIKLMKTRTHILHKVLEGCLQRQEASVLYPYLPKKHEYTVFIPLTKCQWDLYKHYLYSYCKHNKQGILKDFHILQKIWTHPQVLHNFHTKLSDYKKKAKEAKLEDDLAAEDLLVDDIKPTDTEIWWLQYLDGGNMLESVESSNKFVAVFRILKECVELGDKVLIFSTSLFCLDSLEYFLKKINKWSLGQEYYRLDGSVPPEVRHKWCREFNADNNLKTKLFLISTRAGSLGLNMTAANRVIILDTSWNPAHDMQSIFRVYRFGQKKDCFIYRLVAMGTMEQKIYERSVTKQAVACRVVDEQQIDRHYNSADLAELYRLDEAGGSVEGGVAAGVRDVALLRVARDGPVHAVHEHDSLLRASEPALPEDERAAAWQQFQLERAAEQNKPPSTKKGKISAKGVQNAKPQTVVETKQESNTENDAQEPETSKNKKTNIVKCSIPINKPVFFPDDPVKNDIVNNVVHTLIKHSFPNMQEIKDVTDVVNVVRNIVANVQANEDNKDMAIGIIANSMFQNTKVPLASMADTVGKNLNANIETAVNQLMQLQKPVPIPLKKSARLKERQMRTRNQLKQEANYQLDNDTKQKVKKKNVTSAESIAATTSDIVIELNEGVEQSIHDSSGTITAEEVDEPEEPPPPTKKKKHDKKIKKSTDRVIEQPIISDNSILLSDDDDVSIVQPSPSPVTQITQNVVNQKTPAQPISKTQNPVDQKTVAEPRATYTNKEKAKKAKTIELVPLPPSLLTNKHFVTIVAHTYLEGNPMLDEDAATLAAQYSTHKAKKEIESGKTITSGPLYDIAVKALTMETLKKLHNVTPKVPSAKMTEVAASLLLEESLIDLEPSDNHSKVGNPAIQLTPVPAPAPPPLKQLSTKKSSRIREYTPVVETPAPKTYSAVPHVAQIHAVPTSSSNVVPVELFKGPSIPSSGQYSRQNNEESILPDDDSSAINVPPPPLHNRTVDATGTSSKIILNQRKTTPVILRKLFTKSATRPQPTVMQTVPANAQISAISAVGGQIVLDSSQLNNTICLDSDEDEPSTPAGPVPIALTRVNTAQHMPVTRVVSSGGTGPTPGYFIASPASSSTTTFLNPINTYVQPAGNAPALVAINAPINSFAVPPTISTASSISNPVVVSSTSPHITTHPELLPKTIAPNESPVKPNQFILKLHNKTLRLVQTDAPPDTVKTVVKLGKNDKLIPDASASDSPVISKNLKKDQTSIPTRTYMKSLVAIQPAPAVGTEPPVNTENLKKGKSSVLTGSSMKNLVPTKAAPTKVDSKKSVKVTENRRVLSVRSSKDSDTSNSSNSDKREDPLDILKDIVHIQAYDTDNTSQNVESSSNKGKSSQDVTPSTTKTTSTLDVKSPQYKIKSWKESNYNKAKESVEASKKNSAKASGADLLLSFSKETVNTLSNILAKKKASLKASSLSKTSKRKELINVKEILNVKLDNHKSKSNVKTADSFIDLTSSSNPGPSNSKDSKSSKKQSTSTSTESKRDKTKPKVVNITKNIVSIEKPVIKFAKDTIATVDITGESSKNKSSTKVKSNVQQTSSNDKKRSSTTVDVKPPKKKKLEELTLQDFDIDDLDDIIELE